MLVLTDVQKVALAISPVSAAGNPAVVESVSWSVSDDTLFTLEVSEDGLSAELFTTGKLGSGQVNVVADADLGDGVTEVVGALEVSVQASEAVNLSISAGTPETK
jgi:hypothetical protein